MNTPKGTDSVWCGICFDQIEARQISGHACIQRLCIAPHFEYLFSKSEEGQYRFFPIRNLKYAKTVITDGFPQEVYIDCPPSLRAVLLNRYQLQENNNNGTVLSEGQNTPNKTLPSNRQLAALRKDQSTNNMSGKIVPKKVSTQNIIRKSSAPAPLNPAPPKKRICLTSPKAGSESLEFDLTGEGGDDIDYFNQTEDLEKDLDHEDEQSDDRANLLEFMISEVQLRRAIWDSASSHVDRKEQRTRDWNSIFQTMLGMYSIILWKYC